jgi:hypothetical protein
MTEPNSPSINSNRANRARALIVGAIVGGLITGGFLLVIGVLLARQSIPPLTESALTAARERWSNVGPPHYECDLQITGNRPGTVQVRVRRGQVVGLVRDGNANTAERTWRYWSMEGLFDTLERELEMAGGDVPSNRNGTSATAPTSGAILHAQFDDEWGYPKIFRRHVPGQQLDMGWQVTRFEEIHDRLNGQLVH